MQILNRTLKESIYGVTQSLTCYSWARLSDVVGRRPIVLIGATGLAIVTLLLGFCTSLTQIIIVRAVGEILLVPYFKQPSDKSQLVS